MITRKAIFTTLLIAAFGTAGCTKSSELSESNYGSYGSNQVAKSAAVTSSRTSRSGESEKNESDDSKKKKGSDKNPYDVASPKSDAQPPPNKGEHHSNSNSKETNEVLASSPVDRQLPDEDKIASLMDQRLKQIQTNLEKELETISRRVLSENGSNSPVLCSSGNGEPLRVGVVKDNMRISSENWETLLQETKLPEGFEDITSEDLNETPENATRFSTYTQSSCESEDKKIKVSGAVTYEQRFLLFKGQRSVSDGYEFQVLTDPHRIESIQNFNQINITVEVSDGTTVSKKTTESIRTDRVFLPQHGILAIAISLE